MASGLFALLDDVAALARIAAASIDDIAAGAAKAGSKTLGVIIDDAAVTPQYVQGLSPKRELPIIKKIATGSIKNKLLVILPAVLLLSQFLPQALPFLLILGGSYLAYEGAHKIIGKLTGKSKHDTPAVVKGKDAEQSIISNAVRTDFILSAEIMVIALNEVSDASFWQRAAILFVVAIAITVLVYGVVALIVKTDDIGLALTKRDSEGWQKFGQGLINLMPKVMTFLTVVGTIAMLWVGGHIILAQLAELGLDAPYNLLHTITEPIAGIASVGGFLAWLVDTLVSALFGLVWGAIIYAIIHALPVGKKIDEQPHNDPSVTATPVVVDKSVVKDSPTPLNEVPTEAIDSDHTPTGEDQPR